MRRNFMRMRISSCIINVLSAVVLLASPACAEDNNGQRYVLGPGDKLEVKVYNLRAGSGEAYQWTALNGEFIVSAASSLSLPLVGEVSVVNIAPSELADKIAERLQVKVGLAQRPDASVQVVKYRPFYVVGDVDKSGEYEYHPGLTVLQAVSMAGGAAKVRNADALSVRREALNQRGEIRALINQRSALMAREARLNSELNNSGRIDWPKDLGDSSYPKFAGVLENEQDLLRVRQESIQSQQQIINQNKTLLKSEIESLNKKDLSLERQVDLSKRDLDLVNSLAAKGLSITSRQLAAEQTAATLENNRLDVQLQRLRAQEGVGRADRELADLTDKRKSDVLLELVEVRNKIALLAEQLKSRQNVLAQLSAADPDSDIDPDAMPTRVYTIVRKDGKTTKSKIAEESELLEPGDVLKVDTLRSRSNPLSGAAGSFGAGTSGSIARPEKSPARSSGIEPSRK